MAGGTMSAVQRNVLLPCNTSTSVATATKNNDNSCSEITHSEAMLQGLNALRCAQKLFDVTLIVENRSFKAHKIVLAACSDYFNTMFTDAAFNESKQSEIHLNGVNARGIELLLDYAYTAKLELDRNNIQDVLSVSTHVQMKAVIDACSNYLESQIDMENCVPIAALADLYALQTLKRKVYRFICARFDEFAQTADLNNLSLEQLEYILFCNYAVDCTEKRILQITLQYSKQNNVPQKSICQLLKHIRFKHIDVYDLNAIIKDLKSLKNLDLPLVIKFVQNEMKRKLRNIKKYKDNLYSAESKCSTLHKHSDFEDIETVDVLLNSRGMELALVKIGGFETNGLTNQICSYLPSKGKWEKLTVIPHIEQCNYGTAILGNDLYIVGGSYDVCLKEYIHPFGFRYCPTKNTWTTIAPIQADRCRFSLNAMGNNYLYAVGGVCELNENDYDHYYWQQELGLSNCERYNANIDRWEYIPPLTENRSQHAGVVCEDKLYISGGFDRQMVLSSLWCFNTNSFKWEKLRNMITPRVDHVLLAIGNYIYACGGWYEDADTEMRVLAETIDVYDIANDQWTVETINPMPKYYTGVAAVKRKIYFIGGLMSNETINRATSVVQCYNLDTKEWTCNSEWEYPMEIWECTCVALYVPREHEDVKYFW